MTNLGEAFGGTRVSRNDNDPSLRLRPGSGSGSKDLAALSATKASPVTQKAAAAAKNGFVNNNSSSSSSASARASLDSHVPVAMTKPYHHESGGSGGASSSSSSSSQPTTSTTAAAAAAAASAAAPARGFQSPRGVAPRGGRQHDSAGHAYPPQGFRDGGGAYSGRSDGSLVHPSRGLPSTSTSPQSAVSGGAMAGGRDSTSDQRVNGEAVRSATQPLGASSRLPPAPVLPRQQHQHRSAANLTAAAASAMASAASRPSITPTHNLFNHGNSDRQVFSPHLGSNGLGGRRDTPVLKTEPVPDI